MRDNDEIDAGRLVLRTIRPEVALALLEGRVPDGVILAPGYPSEFSIEVMDLVAGERAGQASGFGPYFMVRKADGAVIGEIGAGFDAASATAQVGYTVVESCWGQGYATEALRALLDVLRSDPAVRLVKAETLVGHVASRRVLEKAGLRPRGQRIGDVDGQPAELVIYEAQTNAPAGGASPSTRTPSLEL